MKMRRSKMLTTVTLAIAIILCLSSLKVPASAMEEASDSQLFHITLFCEDNGKPLCGAGFSLYHLGKENADGEIVPEEAFREYSLEIQHSTKESWPVLASTMEGYIIQDQILPAAQGVTDSFGRLTLEVPEQVNSNNVYLLMGNIHKEQESVYETAPVIISRAGVAGTNFTMYPKYAKRDPEVISRKVVKTWDDKNRESRPKEVTIYLWKDGMKWDTVVLNAANHWSYQWAGLDGSCAWKVTEVREEDYAVSITLEGSSFEVTNSFTGTDKPKETTPPSHDKKLPQSGQLWWPVPMLLLVGITFIFLGKLMKRQGSYE